MAQILVRDLDPRAVERLKKHARESGRSLQGEVKEILERSSEKMTSFEFRRAVARLHRKLRGRRFSDSSDLIRQDRAR